jgi:peptidyl-prolyl cis-trans isomerase A (cyclophilin A)
MRILACILTITLILYFNSSGQSGKKKEDIIIRSEKGEIHVRLDLRKAPVTSLNFLRYVDANLFDSTCFYRVVRFDNQPKDSVMIDVIQGGLYDNEDKGFPPIMHETTEITGLRHRNGTISMARSIPGSATSEFFICLGAQPELDFLGKRNPDRQGFAAFGKVIKGMDVVRTIHHTNSSGQYLERPVLITKIVRAGKQVHCLDR